MKINWDYPDPHTLDIEVQESDIDGLGHANNANYVIWCEQCAWQHSESLGLSVSDYQKLDRGVAIHEAGYTYYRPGLAGDRLRVATWLVRCDGKLRLERHFQIVNQDNGQTLLRGYWKLVSVILSSGKATRLPKLFVDTYSSAVVELAAAVPGN